MTDVAIMGAIAIATSIGMVANRWVILGLLPGLWLGLIIGWWL